MADDSGNEDQWLYGDATETTDHEIQDKTVDDSSEEKTDRSRVNDIADDSHDKATEPTENSSASEAAPQPAAIPAPVPGEAEGDDEQSQDKDEEAKENGTGTGDDEDDSDEDDVHVIINDIKTSPTYTSLNIKRGGLLTSSGGADKLKQPGKFSIEEFEAVGSINGVPAHEYNLDSVEDKPWRKPGADITDYFNYGFNEDTWRAYCERQKRLRIHESGVGLAQLGSTGAGRGVIPVAITNDNSKYSGFMGPKKAGPPPGRRLAGTIDVIGVGGLASRRNSEKGTPPKENVIQVMTADRREYSRKPFPDMSVPPPAAFDLPPPPHGVIPPAFPPPPGHMDGYGSDFYSGDADPYYQAYEPTQDLQWKDNPSGQAVKVMTPRPIVTTLAGLPPDARSQDSRGSEDTSRRRGRSTSRLGDDKDLVVPGTEKDPRERKDRGERAEKERHRDRTHRRKDRSRSRSTERRSRRHKSRSRSPGHRSHRKKKSRHAEREKSKEDTE
ncbi:pre-mRNA 3'-end-processing factor FIP1-like isoform X2 [Bacillus rossius redtenbacheri]|uniref:pre-mRNA 3'-end-processing factor FIP1-like isoform X2 n=1 Tax=Bacillus rossius redtenbacheri TaxID=93214 RepID=UPI002FDEA304